MRQVFLCLCAFTWILSPAAAAPKKSKPAETVATELWSLAFPGAHPQAAFFDAASSALFVSVGDAEGARVDRVSLEGKLLKKGVTRAKGAPGSLRAYDGRIYWIAGDQVMSFTDEGTLSLGRLLKENGDPVDLALGRSGAVFVGMSDGSLLRLEAGLSSVEFRGQPITGLFLLEDTLFILRGTRLQSVTLANFSDPESNAASFCSVNCYGLERTSSGYWLTTQKGKVLEVDGTRTKVLLTTGKSLGRPAYVYRKDPKDDFFVIPFPEEGMVRAFRMTAPSLK